MDIPQAVACSRSRHSHGEQAFPEFNYVPENVGCWLLLSGGLSLTYVPVTTFSSKDVGSNPRSTNAIYEGRIIYTPSSFLDLIPDYYKQKPISLYDPREGPLLNQYRLVVPRTRNILEVTQYVVLIILYAVFMAESDHMRFSILELLFSVYAFGWCLEQFATVLGHGWLVALHLPQTFAER